MRLEEERRLEVFLFCFASFGNICNLALDVRTIKFTNLNFITPLAVASYKP